MKHLLLSSLCIVFCTFSALAQLNVELVSRFQYEEGTNDIWGWADNDGIEYALVGTVEGFSVVSLEDPANPVELEFIKGSTNTWRDIKTWENFAYVTTEANDGLLIVDLSTVENDTADFVFYKPEFDGLGTYRKAHNIYIDERGLIYLSGSNLSNGGVIVLDATVDPWAPEPLGAASDIYSHDAYAKDGILFSSEIYAGNLSLYQVDVEPFASTLLGQTKTPYEFTHNAWATPDNKTVFTTDERANAPVASYDVSDVSDIKELDRFRPASTFGEGVIPHNVHVLNDYLIISYYTDGCIIVDASRPDNLIEVGNYDSYLGGSGGYNGVWGAYPFLPSGTVLITDRGNGLYVLTPTYVRACYLEGTVKDASTFDPIFQASVSIEADEDVLPELTKFDGTYKTGKAVPGTFNVTATAKGYYPRTLEIELANGVLVEQEFLLEAKPRYEVTGSVMSAKNSAPAPNANVYLTDGDFTYQTVADENGAFFLPEVVEGTYEVYASLWGEYIIGSMEITSEGPYTITLDPGYYDDFFYNYDWTVSGTSTEAEWERAMPSSQLLFGFIQCGPRSDVADDFGSYAYVTGNEGTDASFNAVEAGYSLLSSPMMDLNDYSNVELTYRPWLCRSGQMEPSYIVFVSNAQDTVAIDTFETNGAAGFWADPINISLDGKIEFNDAVQVHFMAIDTFTTSETTVKAGLDVFVVTGDYSPSAVVETPGGRINIDVFPNPFSTSVSLRVENLEELDAPEYQVMDLMGRSLTAGNITSSLQRIDIPQAAADGIYLVRITDKNGVATTVKVARVSNP